MTKTILFSLDVLTNSQHREGYKTNGDWDSYREAFSDDEPKQEMIDLLNVLADFYEVSVFSDMPDTSRQTITDWLISYEANVEEVLLAPNYSRGSIATKRIEAIREGCDFSEIVFCFESNLAVVEALREEGVVCMECAG